jgi:hypothetical protein
MNRTIIVLTLFVLAAGCRHKDDKGNPSTSTLPGAGSTVITQYSGAVAVLDTRACLQDCFQNIPVNADVLDYPADALQVYLCRNAVCDLQSLPAKTCTELGATLSAMTTPCYTSSPSTAIVYGNHVVRLVNAFESWCIDQNCTEVVPGYSSYAIQTTITR